MARNLTTATREAWHAETSTSKGPGKSSTDWPRLSQDNIESLVKDPWFSSLWCLQEAFLCPGAIILSKEAKYIEEDTRNVVRLSYILARADTIYNSAQEKVSSTNQLAFQLKSLVTLIERTGLAALYTQNPMTLLTIARFRQTTRDLDRVYGIMQIFGDKFKIGEANGGPAQNYSIEELEDEFGALLLDQHPVLSQMHVHTKPPPLSSGWRICTASEIPPFAANPEDYDRNDNSLFGEPETVCKFATRKVAGRVWGYLNGQACPFAALQRLWVRQFAVGSPQDWSEPPLSIALDRVDVLESMHSFDRNAVNIDERQHKLASRLSEVFEGKRMLMFMLAREVFGDWVIEGDTRPRRDRFLGMILLQREDQGRCYWHRLGICRWTSYSAKTSEPNEADKATLLGHGNEWQQIEGVFG